MQHLHHPMGLAFIEMQRGMTQTLPRSLFITAQDSDVEHQQGVQAGLHCRSKPFDSTTVAVLIRITINAL